MDGATLDLNDLKAVFGSSLIDLNKGQERQTNILMGLQDLIDQKIESVTDHLKKLDDVVDAARALQKGETKKNTSSITKKISSIPQGMSNVLSSMIKPFTSSSKAGDTGSKKAGIKIPFQRETVNIEFTPKTKVMLQDILDVTIEALYDKFTPHLDDISDTLQAILKNTVKAEQKPKGILDYIGDIAKIMGPILGPLLLMLGGAAASIAGIATIINGLTDTGPLKGLKKILGKGGLQFGLNTIKKGAAKLLKVFSTIGKLFFSDELITSFKDTIKTIGKKAFEKISYFPKLFFNKVKNFLYQIPGKLVKYVKGFFGIGEKALAAGVKAVPKAASGGFFKSILSGLGKFFSKEVLTKIPIIGSVLSLSFAYSRFKSGDPIGGVVDVLSALSGLLYLVPGGAPFALALVTGLDVFNAFLDIKAGGSDKKAGAKKLDIFKDIFKKIGDAIMGVLQSIVAGFVDLLPDKVLGIPVKSRVADLLKGSGFDVEAIKAQQQKEAEAAIASKSNTTPKSTANNVASTPETTTAPNKVENTTSNITGAPETAAPTTSIKPKAQPVPNTTPNTTGTDSTEGIDGMHGSIKDQNRLMQQLLTFSQQTAENTNALIMTFKENTGGKNVQINNVSSPTTFFSSPASSPDFRASVINR